jgi:adenosyl cobinamide kinase/adenosyl cobinamide phosphate guanylyltransferase
MLLPGASSGKSTFLRQAINERISQITAGKHVSPLLHFDKTLSKRVQKQKQ